MMLESPQEIRSALKQLLDEQNWNTFGQHISMGVKVE